MPIDAESTASPIFPNHATNPRRDNRRFAHSTPTSAILLLIWLSFLQPGPKHRRPGAALVTVRHSLHQLRGRLDVTPAGPLPAGRSQLLQGTRYRRPQYRSTGHGIATAIAW